MAKKKSNRAASAPRYHVLRIVDDPPETKSEKVDVYAGVSLAGAQARFRDLAEEACEVLPVDLLGCISSITALFLDQHLNGTRITRLHAAEKAEKTEMGQWWQEFARKNADIHGA